MHSFGFLLVVVAMTVACSSSGSTSNDSSRADAGTGTGPATLSDFAVKYCDLVGPTCCREADYSEDPGKCKNAVLARYTTGTYDPSSGQHCLDAIAASSAASTFCLTPAEDAASTAACAHVTKSPTDGTKAIGASCIADVECAPSPEGDVSCAVNQMGSNGLVARVCRVLLHAKAGEACHDAAEVGAGNLGGRVALCFGEDGLACDDGTKTCVPRIALGAACNPATSFVCADGAYCNIASRTCMATVASGQPCTEDDQCGAVGLCTKGMCHIQSWWTANCGGPL